MWVCFDPTRPNTMKQPRPWGFSARWTAVRSGKPMMNASTARCCVPLCSVCAWLLSAVAAAASTVVPMDIKTLADHAGQVIIGTVASVRSYESEHAGGIESQIVFSDVIYLKGAPPAPALRESAGFTLIAPGGTVGERTMRVCCAPRFVVGQRRLLFLLPTYKTFPTVGLEQGAFLIVRDAQGVERVYQEGMIPVTNIGADWFAQTAVCPSSNAEDRLVAESGVRVVRRDASCSVPPAIPLNEFLAILQPILDASTDHHLTQPAGRRVPADLSAVPLVPAKSAANEAVEPAAKGGEPR